MCARGPGPRGHRRLLAGPPVPDLASHQRAHGSLPYQNTPGTLIGAVEASGPDRPRRGRLSRPGASWRPSTRDEGRWWSPTGPRASRPAARTARCWPRRRHLVLDGLQLAAEAVGAKQAYVYARAESTLTTALDDRRAAAWDRVPVTLLIAPDDFVAGEESAVVAAIEGRPALPPRQARAGRRLGLCTATRRWCRTWRRWPTSRSSPATARAGSASRAPMRTRGRFWPPSAAVWSRPACTSSRTAYPSARRCTPPAARRTWCRPCWWAAFHGAWVPPDGDLPVTRRTLRPFGAAPGAGLIIALPDHACGLASSSAVADYLAGQSAGQCGPCRLGLPHIAELLRRLAQGERSSTLAGEIDRAGRLDHGPRGVPPPGRDHAVRPQRAAGVRARGHVAPGRRLPGPGGAMSAPRFTPRRPGPVARAGGTWARRPAGARRPGCAPAATAAHRLDRL
jgi:hypothetical protein